MNSDPDIVIRRSSIRVLCLAHKKHSMDYSRAGDGVINHGDRELASLGWEGRKEEYIDKACNELRRRGESAP